MPSFDQATKRDLYFKALDEEIRELLNPETGLLDPAYSSRVCCPLCDAERDEEIFKKRGYTFVRCADCGMVYTNPMVDAKKVQECYKKSRANDLWVDVLLSQTDQSWRRKNFGALLEMAEAHTAPGRLLDIGCSVGHFMEIARERAWRPVGLELGERAAAHACEQLELDVRRQLLSDAGFEPGSFDAVSAIGVLEHLPRPIDLLKEARPLIRQGGAFIAQVPNTYSLQSMIVREKMATFDGRNHLCYFSQETLRRAFENAGYTVLKMDTILAGLGNIARALQYRDPAGADPERSSLPAPIREILEREETERWVIENGLGLKLRVIAAPA